jgi:hypothetical protein
MSKDLSHVVIGRRSSVVGNRSSVVGHRLSVSGNRLPITENQNLQSTIDHRQSVCSEPPSPAVLRQGAFRVSYGDLQPIFVRAMSAFDARAVASAVFKKDTQALVAEFWSREKLAANRILHVGSWYFAIGNWPHR